MTKTHEPQAGYNAGSKTLKVDLLARWLRLFSVEQIEAITQELEAAQADSAENNQLTKVEVSFRNGHPSHVTPAINKRLPP